LLLLVVIVATGENPARTTKEPAMIFCNKHAVAHVREIEQEDDLALEGYWPNWFVLTGIQAGEPGHASEVLDKLCEKADAAGWNIVLCPIASGRLGQKELIGWYERRNFQNTGTGYMIRKAGRERAARFAAQG